MTLTETLCIFLVAAWDKINRDRDEKLDVGGLLHPPNPHMSIPPHIKLEAYGGISDWTQYQIYFDNCQRSVGGKIRGKPWFWVYA